MEKEEEEEEKVLDKEEEDEVLLIGKVSDALWMVEAFGFGIGGL